MIKYLLVFLIAAGAVNAQTFNKSKLDSLFNLIELNSKGMGSFSIFSNGEEVYTKSFGYGDVANKMEANNLTKYRVGSISKTITATIIMQLVEEKKLTLSTLLSDYFPSIPNANKITIEDLLRHESGLFNITSDPAINQWKSQQQSREKMIARITNNGIIFEPKEKTEYSNTNYVLLSYVAEIIEKMDFQNIVDYRIVAPLKLARTEFGGDINSANNEALPYDFTNAQWELINPQTNLSGPMGAGGIVATPSELNIFYNALFSDLLVSNTSLAKMKDAHQGVGLGLMKLPLGNKEVYGHGGSIDGFQSFAAYFPADNVSFALSTNYLYTQVSNIFIGAVQIYFGMNYNLPNFSPIKTIQLSEAELEVYLGTYGSPTFPIDITITRDKTVLMVQGEGQGAFPVDAIDKDTFYSEDVMIRLQFIPEQNKMIVQQGGQTSELTKQ